jgi:hypothetical protein
MSESLKRFSGTIHDDHVRCWRAQPFSCNVVKSQRARSGRRLDNYDAYSDNCFGYAFLIQKSARRNSFFRPQSGDLRHVEEFLRAFCVLSDECFEGCHLVSPYQQRGRYLTQTGETKIFSIEEAKAARPTVFLNIPVGACREFGDEAIKRSVEDQTMAAEAETTKGIRNALSRAWRKLTGHAPIAAQAEEATR